MSNIAVVYHSKHGSTEKYAKWIAEETGAVLFKEKECKAKQLVDFDVIVYGGAVHAGGILGINFLQKGIKDLVGKKVVVFAVGLNVDDEKIQEECREINFVKELADLPCYFLKGAYDPEKIKGVDKAIMSMTKKMINRDSQLYRDIENGADYVDIRYIEPILKELK